MYSIRYNSFIVLQTLIKIAKFNYSLKLYINYSLELSINKYILIYSLIIYIKLFINYISNHSFSIKLFNICNLHILFLLNYLFSIQLYLIEIKLFINYILFVDYNYFIKLPIDIIFPKN